MLDTTDRTAVLMDAHPIWLDAVAMVLERVDVRVVGAATTTEAALMLVTRHQPDLLLTDTHIGTAAAGCSLIREARARHGALRVVALSSSSAAGDVEEALEAGAVAYVLKSAHPDDLASAVRQAFSHSVFLAAGGPGKPAPMSATASQDDGPGADLTKREREILRLVAEGHSNAQLARMLWVTEQTVKFHLSNVYRKLDVANRTEAARWAQLHGFLSSKPELTAA